MLQVSSGLSQAIAAGGCHLVSSGTANTDACCNPYGTTRSVGGARRAVSAGEGLQNTLRRLLEHSDSRENVYTPGYAVSSGLSQAIAAGGCHLVSSGTANTDACCNPYGTTRSAGGARRAVSAGEGLQNTLRRLLEHSDSRENVYTPGYAASAPPPQFQDEPPVYDYGDYECTYKAPLKCLNVGRHEYTARDYNRYHEPSTELVSKQPQYQDPRRVRHEDTQDYVNAPQQVPHNINGYKNVVFVPIYFRHFEADGSGLFCGVD
ncbi:hypothetical protein RR46_00229 [Papilio xuthus]|uniref:Uncharacterized protein n=1 Tax=Papilio xuthus TaxID=66420 RepID=A0A0N1IB72_PAPXU|nr:hypothetical protein RR46_00229 [Papilio xuthus]